MLKTIVSEDRKVRTATMSMHDGSAISSTLNCFGYSKKDSTFGFDCWYLLMVEDPEVLKFWILGWWKMSFLYGDYAELMILDESL